MKIDDSAKKACRVVLDGIAQRRAQQQVLRGRRFLDDGQPEQALACCKKVPYACRDSWGAYELMARALMPGGHYWALLRLLHEQLRPRTYLEIGVHRGDSLALAGSETSAVGIDPAPAINVRIRSRARL
ncbi:hypothetical protein FJY68_13975 [candidate division WOR-3 bacterium]|uniref:Class I SAM-dependent methyltransferase n=1 Tax=candidate division WOR-3 bacterium TaxID=2052148 RepID=A0A937XFU8_UNCW3|nr:hypothetical protein [candidate division WOR-3 bacterium]